jgi:DNA-binding protein YbaB
MTGKYDVIKLTINPEILAHGVGAVESAVMAAYMDAKQKADTMIDKVMGDATAGIPMP